MLTAAIIERTLKNKYTSTIRKRGYDYYRAGKVEDYQLDEETGAIQAEVSNNYGYVYKVEFELTGSGQFLTGRCNCPYDGNCKHQVAVLYEVEDLFEEQESYQTSKADSGESPKKKRTSVAMSNLLEENFTSEYRKLPLIDNRLERALVKYRPGRYQGLSWSDSFEGRFISENELELKSIPLYKVYNFKEQKIVLRIQDGDLYVKCLSCNLKSRTLCRHQMALLSYTQHILFKTGFLAAEVNYETIREKGIRSFGVEPEAFSRYFEIILKPDGFFIVAKGEGVVGPKWLETARELLDSKREERKKRIADQTAVLEDGRDRKYAFLWGSDYFDQDNSELLFVSGYRFKTKEGIHTQKRKITESPEGFQKEYKQLGYDLFMAFREEDDVLKFERVKNLIVTNLDLLNSFYQYILLSNSHPVYHPVKSSDLKLVKFQPGILQCKFKIYRKDGLIHFERKLTLDDKDFDYSKIIYTNSVFCATKGKAFVYANPYFRTFMTLFDEKDLLVIPYYNKKEYTELIQGMRQFFEVEVSPGIIMDMEILEAPKYQILLREVSNFVLFEPRLQYGEYSFNAFDSESYRIDEKVFRANESDGHFLVDFLKKAHPNFNNDIQIQDYVFLDIKAMMNNHWFVRFNEACEAAGIEVLGQKNLTKFRYSKYRASVRTHVRSGIDWFEVDMGLSFGDEKVKTADWIRAVRNKETFVTLKDGSLGILPEEWLKQAKNILAVADVEKNKLKISKYRFNIIEDLFETIDDKKVVKELQKRKERLAKIDLTKKHEIPKMIRAELRDYQKHGFSWLKFLDESGFGGILADDMGLGKTLQVITLLADQIDREPSLVIVPRSLLFNWAAELDKFCPDLQYVIHHGPNRSKLMEEILPCHLIITTYGTAAADIEILKDFKFNYIILDESQAIKNPNSKRYKAMRVLQARNKLAMTGTPIENNTFDLYAQLSFTSPGLLGNQTSFKNNFAIPIDNYGDKEAAELLRKLIHPFLLRRTKEQVAKDLPDKTESIIYCEMGSTQRKLYDNLKRKIKEDIEAAVEEKGIAQSKFQMLDGLLRLRQMCNSPLLLNSSFTGANAESVKIDLLLHQITEELGAHNALIFSQFTSLLAIVRSELDQRGVSYAYLDGSTTKRQQEVEKFMDQDEIKVFLISLKAGNTGMNLTKADYVYILDPWWNPAVENQAIDRTHRIGQDKHVFAYKLICKDTIEEKILQLQEKKKNLAKDIIRTDENVLKSLDKDELLALFD